MARIRTLNDVHPARRGLILAWWAFTATFGGLRLLTWAIHVHVRGLGNISAGGVHIHHYLWGILLLTIVAAAGLIERTPARHSWQGLLFGIGLALVVDEAALLIELKDVYWDNAGGVSVAIALILIGLVGSLLALTSAPGIEIEERLVPGHEHEHERGQRGTRGDSAEPGE